MRSMGGCVPGRQPSYRVGSLAGAAVFAVLMVLVFPALVTAAVLPETADAAEVPDGLLPLLVPVLGALLNAFSPLRRRWPGGEETELPPERAEGPAGPGEGGVRSIRPETTVSHRLAVERAVLAMRDRLEEDLTLKDLASKAFISPYHFNRIFKQLVGIPPCQFLGALRLQEAKRLLLSTHLSITDICFQVGYSSLGTFTRRFTSLVGLSPRQFRALAGLPAFPLGELAAELRSAGAERGAVRGQLGAEEGFQGVAFLGLFATSIPQGVPVACTLAAAPGPFAIPECPDGDYFLFAAGLPEASDGEDQILGGTIRRGSHGRLVRIRDGRADGPVDIVLRSPDLIDPPILITMHLLLQERFAGSGTDVRAISEKPLSGGPSILG